MLTGVNNCNISNPVSMPVDCDMEKPEIHFPEGRRCSRVPHLRGRGASLEAAQGQGMKTR